MVEMTKKDAPIEPLEKYNYNPENDPKVLTTRVPKGCTRHSMIFKTVHITDIL